MPTDYATLATPDPTPSTVTREEVAAATDWIGTSAPGVLNKRKGWFVGAWRMATDANLGWYRCTSLDSNGNPASWYQLICTGTGSGASGIPCSGPADRPTLSFELGQRQAHGILRERGTLIRIDALTVEREEEGKTIILATYSWTGTQNEAREYLLDGQLTNGLAAHARVCPVTKSLWIEEVPDMPDDYLLGATVYATYTYFAPATSPVDVTDQLNADLNAGNVTLPPGTFYVRTSLMPGPNGVPGGLKIPAGRTLKGADAQISIDPDGFPVYKRLTILRALPPGARPIPNDWEGKERPSEPLGILIVGRNTPTGNTDNFAQQGAELWNLTVDGNMSTLDFLEMTAQPSQSHHGVEWVAVDDVVCEGVRFTNCFDDGLKLTGHKLSAVRTGEIVDVFDSGARFRLTDFQPTLPFPSPLPTGVSVREGMVALNLLPDVNTLIWKLHVPQPSAPDRLYYCGPATEPNGGRCPIADIKAPLTSLNATDPNRIGWLDPVQGEGTMESGHELPVPRRHEDPVTADYLKVSTVPNARAALTNCEYVHNGRNGLTAASMGTLYPEDPDDPINQEPTTVTDNALRGNARLAVSIGLEGAFANDLQLGTTGRWAYEMWKYVVADGLLIAGIDESGFKIGQEKGYRYPVLGPGTYSRVIVRDSAERGMKSSGFYCGPLTFENVWITEIAVEGWVVDHSSGIRATDVHFDNPGATRDLSITRGAYVEGVENLFENLVGEGSARAIVRIAAPGVIIRNAENVHFEVVLEPGDPPVVFEGEFPRCTGIPT